MILKAESQAPRVSIFILQNENYFLSEVTPPPRPGSQGTVISFTKKATHCRAKEMASSPIPKDVVELGKGALRWKPKLSITHNEKTALESKISTFSFYFEHLFNTFKIVASKNQATIRKITDWNYN